MAQFLCPFLITDRSQISAELVTEHNLGLEAIFFDGHLLEEMSLLSKSLDDTNTRFPQRIVSIHFPTEHANYFSSQQRYNQLLQLIDIAEQHSIRKIVVHSNYFEPLGSFNPRALPEVRKHFLEMYTTIDDFLSSRKVVLLVENMPIIGNKGDDFDSVFVFPSDFAGFNHFRSIGVAWDFGHWAFTLQTMSNIERIADWKLSRQAVFDDFKSILPLIKHFHMSSFKGAVFPQSNGECKEGVPMAEGDANPSLFVESIRFLNNALPDSQISLEIQEEDYKNRPNLTRTLAWLAEHKLLK